MATLSSHVRAGRAASRSLVLAGSLQAVVAITVLAALLRFATLDLQSFWYDEAFTLRLLGMPLDEMLGEIPSRELTPPLYFVLAWLWSKPFGTGEVGLRALSALAGTATVPVVFAAARRLVSPRAALVAAALVAVSPLLVWYSQEARAYSLLVFLSAATLLFFATALDEGRSRALWLWAAASSLALATHYFAVFVVAAEAVWLARKVYPRRRVLAPFALVAAVGAALAPLALAQQGGAQWIGGLPLDQRLRELVGQFLLGAYSRDSPNAWWLGVALFAIGVGALFLLTKGRERDGALVALGLALAMLLVPLALTLVGADLVYYRNLVVAWLPLAIVAGAVLAAPRAGTYGLVAAGAACLASAAFVVGIARDSSLHRADWRGATSELGNYSESRAVVVFPGWQQIIYRVYRPTAELPPGGARVSEIDVVGYGLGSLSFHTPPGFRQVETRTVQSLTVIRYRSARTQLVVPDELVGPLGRPEVFLDRRQ